MSTSFADIQEVAETLHAATDEASHRSAVSRNFYAAMHGAAHWIGTTPGMPSVGGAPGGLHTELQNKLRALDRSASPDQRWKGRVLAAKLAALKARRVIADYELSNVLRAEEIAAQNDETVDFLEKCTTAP